MVFNTGLKHTERAPVAAYREKLLTNNGWLRHITDVQMNPC